MNLACACIVSVTLALTACPSSPSGNAGTDLDTIVQVDTADTSADGDSERATETPSADVCVPDCLGKQCGDDGCGGSCGECPTGQACQDDGTCLGCTPECAGKACGDDGCGGGR